MASSLAQGRFVFRTRSRGSSWRYEQEGVVGELPTGPGMQQGEPLEFDWERPNALGSFRWAMKLSGVRRKPEDDSTITHSMEKPGKGRLGTASIESWQAQRLPGKKVPEVSGKWGPSPINAHVPHPLPLGSALLPFKQAAFHQPCLPGGREKGPGRSTTSPRIS